MTTSNNKLPQSILDDLARIYWLVNPTATPPSDLLKQRASTTTCAVLLWDQSEWDRAKDRTFGMQVEGLSDDELQYKVADMIAGVVAAVQVVDSELAAKVKYCLEANW